MISKGEKHMFKKLCAAVIAVLLISGGTYAGQDFISAVSVTAQAANADVWDGTYDTSWYDEEETEFHLSTAAEFAGFAQLVNSGKSTEGKTFYLDKDITLNDISDYKNWKEKAPAHKWDSIGTENFKFAGTFDAQNHTITGLYTSYGLFYDSTGTVKNVKLASAYATSSAICFNNSGTIDNCHADAVVYSSSGSVGGICRSNGGTISNCTMAGSVESNFDGSLAGGICTLNNGIIDKCQNTAFVTASCTTNSGTLYSYAGGIAAYNEKNSSAVISNSYNTGAVTASAKNASASNYNYSYAGGILGYGSASVNISNVYNAGTVSSSTAITASTYYTKYLNTYAGGVIGYISGSATVDINDVYNTGDVIVEDVSGDSYTGGMIGYISNSATVTISNVYNVGKISQRYSSGGISGNGKPDMTACYYLNTTALKGIGDADTDTAVSKTEANMKKESFAQSLGENFVYVKDNFPKLVWEQAEEPTEEPTTEPTETPTESLTEEPTEESTTEPQKQILKLTEYTETATLKVNYNGTITWLSSDANVATVKDGVVTAVGNGKAIIYALCGEQRVETEVEVSYDYYLNQNEFSLASGTQTQLEFHSANNKEIYNQLAEWSSSNEKVAKVDNEGIITAVSAGTAVITAKAGDVSVTCKITVTDSSEPAIFAQSTTIKAGEKKALTISDYSGSVTWVSSDTKVVTVDADGTLTGVKAGTATVYAMLDNGKTISAKITVVNSEIMLGDVTLDGEVDILDVITVNKAVLGKETLTAEQIKAADVSKNDVPDSTDSLMILKYIVGILENLG